MNKLSNLTILFLFYLPLIFANCERKNKNEEPKPSEKEINYDVLKLGELPIGLWVTPPEGYQTSTEYEKIKACGMNFVNGFGYYESSYAKILQALDFCKTHELKFFVNKGIVREDIIKHSGTSDGNLLKKFIEGTKPYANHPAFAGELLIDEPSKNLFNSVSSFAKAFEAEYPDKIAHVNLFPTYATGGIKTSSYSDYINSWLEMVNPKHISYDSYPLLTDGTIITDYYYNLDLVRSKSKFKKIPFWTFIQTLSIAGTPGVPNKREPSETDIRWQVWSNLAFGSKGIQYFCYWTPGSDNEQFGEALIALNGEKTVRYDYVKKLNADMKSIGKILLQCHAEGVIQTAPKEYRMYEQLYHFADIERVEGGDNLVGCFTSPDGKKKVLITTLTPTNDATVTLHLTSNVSKVNVWYNNSSVEQIPVEGKLTFEIKAGEAVFVEF